MNYAIEFPKEHAKNLNVLAEKRLDEFMHKADVVDYLRFLKSMQVLCKAYSVLDRLGTFFPLFQDENTYITVCFTCYSELKSGSFVKNTVRFNHVVHKALRAARKVERCEYCGAKKLDLQNVQVRNKQDARWAKVIAKDAEDERRELERESNVDVPGVREDIGSKPLPSVQEEED